jgi:restriction endonuclease S subunit
MEHTNELGIANSSARILPTGTVCLSRTASVGYVVIMGRPMATSQDFVNWVCSKQLEPRFLQYLLIFEGPSLSRFSSGAVHQTIYFPEVKAFHICLPTVEEQRRIVAVLDEAFAAIATAAANAEKNLANAQELFDVGHSRIIAAGSEAARAGTLGEIGGRVFTGPFGSLLHKRDYTTGGIPLVNPSHIENGRIVPGDDKCVSPQTAERLSSYRMKLGDIVFGRRGEMGRCAVVTESEEGFLCGTGSFFIRPFEQTDPNYLAHLLRSKPYRKKIETLASGATMPNLSNTALSQLMVKLPDLPTQRALVRRIRTLDNAIGDVISLMTKKVAELAALKPFLLRHVFAGELTDRVTACTPVNDNFATSEFAAQLLAVAHARHMARGCAATFGRVKAQKTLHVAEAIGRLDLGRQPIRDAAGPNDFAHMRHAENWARQQGFFEFVQRTSGGYDFRPLQNYGKLIDEAKRRVEQAGVGATRAIELLVEMDSDRAEIVVTTHAAWNNLVLDSASITDDAIVRAARDNWHPAKLRYDPMRFRDAIRFIRQNGIEPDGSAKRVGGQESLPL